MRTLLSGPKSVARRKQLMSQGEIRAVFALHIRSDGQESFPKRNPVIISISQRGRGDSTSDGNDDPFNCQVVSGVGF